jgi:hypothetical protein
MLRRSALIGVMLAVTVAAVASAGTAGVYSGKTSQHLALTVTATGSKITKIKYAANYGACGADLFGTSKVSIPIKNGKVSDNARLNSEVTMNLTGAFKGKKFNGSFKSSITEGGIHPQTCPTGKVKFKLTRA